MRLFALLLIIIASIEVGVMSELRKSYQIKNGMSIVPTALFMLITNAFAVVTGAISSGEIIITLDSVAFATLFSITALVTGILCLVGTAWGNVSIIVTCALLGKLVLPSAYGMIVLPEENVMTLYKVFGFIFAVIALTLNFASSEQEQKSKNSVKFKVACVIVFFTQGLALIIFNIVTRRGMSGGGFVTQYMTISMLIMVVALLISLLKNPANFKTELKRTMSIKSMLIMVGYAVLIFMSDKLSITCAGMVPLIFQAPVEFCVPIIVIAVMDYLIYREKLNKRQFVQLAAAFLSCICFML